MKLVTPSQWSIAWRVRLGMLVVPLILLALAVFQFRISHIVNDRYSSILYHATLLLTSQNMMHGIENMEAAEAQYVEKPTLPVWNLYQSARESVDKNYRDSLQRATWDSSIDEKLKTFYSAHQQWRMQVSEPAIKAARAGHLDVARSYHLRRTLEPQQDAFSELRRTAVATRERQIAEADQLRRWWNNWLIAVEAITLMLTMVLVTGIVRQVTQPMNELVEQSRRIETGDYNPSIVTRTDEFGSVIQAMNDMAAAVRMREEELKVARDTIASNGEELQKKNLELEEFVYSVSHDLKAPIISMQGYLAALQTDHRAALNDEAQFFVERAVANSEHLQNLISDLIELSRVGRVQEIPETFDSMRLMQQIIDELVPHAAVRGIKVEIAGKLPLVCGARKQLYQVFVNLIENAIKYSDAAQPERWVRIECTENDGEWRFVVRDNGIGIPERQREKVFNMFQRAGNSKEPGTGIGLSIVKRVAEAHGGRAWAEASGVGAGSAFYVTIAKPRLVTKAEGESGVLPADAIQAGSNAGGTEVAYSATGGVT